MSEHYIECEICGERYHSAGYTTEVEDDHQCIVACKGCVQPAKERLKDEHPAPRVNLRNPISGLWFDGVAFTEQRDHAVELPAQGLDLEEVERSFGFPVQQVPVVPVA
jgi:hypothetical protein